MLLAPTKEQIIDGLGGVNYPEIGKNIVDLKMVKDTRIDEEGNVVVTANLTVGGCPFTEDVEDGIRAAISALPAVSTLVINKAVMSREEVQQLFELLRKQNEQLMEELS